MSRLVPRPGRWKKSQRRRLWRWWRQAKRRIRGARNPTCLDCGYLAKGDSEASTVDRWRLAAIATAFKRGSSPGIEPHLIIVANCWRSAWTAGVFARADEAAIADELSEDRRKCPHFVSYTPNRGPAQHLARQEKDLKFEQEAALRKRLARLSFWGALLGSSLVPLIKALVDRL